MKLQIVPCAKPGQRHHFLEGRCWKCGISRLDYNRRYKIARREADTQAHRDKKCHKKVCILKSPGE